ncbi:hypothetical protein SCLCIDRAFT_1224918 [Scleroderma citrinum Foug A]|uniref:Uncharacterized protein n=1 Tax=Scleroderma citrinum Foug A TaxID=1036808 RepID=A0A0C2ZDF6_9AGAM|nr:hypothetical protein SCLCIDRAFT_1224918 [Scleroderma citrinum Foug A]
MMGNYGVTRGRTGKDHGDGGDPRCVTTNRIKCLRGEDVSAEPVVDSTRSGCKHRSTGPSGVYTLQYRITYSHR